MKTLRICLLLLLAALLPVRGVVAAAMNCPPALHGMQGEASIAAGSTHDHHAMREAPDHGRHEAAGQPDSAGKCHLCCDFCSAPLMPGSASRLPVPQDWSPMSFPDLLAPAPSFLSGGQERPPRST